MSRGLDSAVGELPGQRAPAVVVAGCFAGGILLDRWLPVPWSGWLLAIAAGLCGLLILRNRHKTAAVVLILACCAAFGGARHHLYVSVAEPDDIALFATTEPRLVHITGTITSSPEVTVHHDSDEWSAYPQLDTTASALACRSLKTEEGDVPVSGRARLQVRGDLSQVRVGDIVSVDGWLQLAPGPANPGEFDFRGYLSGQGQRCIVRTYSPEAVSRIGQDDWFAFRHMLARLRDESGAEIEQSISEPNVALAKSLLLGDRSEMPQTLRDSFAASGTMHFLAISGLHVGILALFVWALCRLFNLSPAATTRVCLAIVLAYALLVDLRPPVVRALVMLTAMSFGVSAYRPGNAANNLAIAALVVLVWNPADLFNVGAQLSFLAVIGILAAVRLQRSLNETRPTSGLDSLAAESRLPVWLAGAWAWLKRSYVVLGAIWLLTAPLVAARFHLVSPVGLLINVFLMPLVSLIMISGFLFLLCMWLLPPVAFVFAFVFDGGLSLLRMVVEHAGRLRFGHFHVSGPDDWWLVGFYALIGLWLAPIAGHRWKRRVGVGLGLWIIAGMCVGLMSPRQADLQFSVLSAGHGCATVIRFPNGKALVYDAGNLQDGRRAERTVRQALWDDGLNHVDALVVSHADMDHFSGVPGLLETMPIGSLMVSQPFLHFDQQGVEAVCETAVENGVPIRLLCRGDRLRLDEATTVEVLHPGWKSPAADDNADSVVLFVEYAGRTILLPGDLEGHGLDQLLSSPDRKVDILLAPHHGSLGSNTPRLAAWAQPDYVLVSSSGHTNSEALQAIYGDSTEVLSTASAGAIVCRIDPAGAIDVKPFFEPPVRP